MSNSEIDEAQVALQEIVNELVLAWHLHQMVSLLPQPANRRKHAKTRVDNSLVLLGPQLGDEMSETDRRASSANASAAMNNRLFRGV